MRSPYVDLQYYQGRLHGVSKELYIYEVTKALLGLKKVW